jgi:rhodanese-related sulfurtransferase
MKVDSPEDEMSKLKKLLCGSGSESVRPPKEITALIAKGAFILDVRTKMEAKKGVAPGATSIPLLRLKRHLDELPHDRTIVTYCGTGERAGKAKDILEANGFRSVNGGGYDGMLKILAAGATP